MPPGHCRRDVLSLYVGVPIDRCFLFFIIVVVVLLTFPYIHHPSPFFHRKRIFFFFSFYIIDVLDQQIGISFSRLSREDTRLDLLLYFIIIFLLLFLLSILLLGLLLLIILLLSLSCTTRRECAQKKKKKKKEEKQFRSVRCLQWKRFEARFHIMLLHRVYCPLRRGLERKKMEKIEEKMSPLSLPSRLKDDSMCDKSSL